MASRVPDGYAAVDLDPGTSGGPLRVAVLFRVDGSEDGSPFVRVRDLLGGRALLGCVVDSAGVVHQWLEIWVQRVAALAEESVSGRGRLSNASMDADWSNAIEAAEGLGDHLLIRCGFEVDHPRPTYVDPEGPASVHPCDKNQAALRLCQDEGLLATKGLPSYGATLHRYLYVPEVGDDSPFVPVTPDAPTSETTVALQFVVDGAERLVPLNPEGGLVQVRRYSPIDFESFVDVLGGGSWHGVFSGPEQLAVGETLRGLSQASTVERLAEGHLVLGSHGRAGRLGEVFHIKLRLLHDAIESVRASMATTQHPFLNLAPGSFQVSLGQMGSGLPYLWTARAVLNDPGDAVAFPVDGSELNYYLRGREFASAYQPESGQRRVSAEGSVRIRRVIKEAEGRASVEGTLYTQEKLTPAVNDLVLIRLPVSDTVSRLFARIEFEKDMPAGELRFRTVPQGLGDDTTAAIEALAGVPVDKVEFEEVPLISSPCDLYALGVLAIRTLLVDADQPLPVAKDELLSLAREVATIEDGDVALSTRIQGIASGDPRWLEALGPQRLVRDAIEPGQAFDFVPPSLWFQTLAMLVRMFPGASPESICDDLGDAAPGGIHRILDPIVTELEDLLVRSRSLVVVDWTANREIHAVIRQMATGLVGG